MRPSFHTNFAGHIQWGAATLRRCMAMCPAPELQIDIFVTNMKPSMNPPISTPPKLEEMADEGELAPPEPHFSRDNRFDRSDKQDPRSSSVASIRSVDDDGFREDVCDTSYYQEDMAMAERSELGHEEHVLDLTNFDGDDDTAIPGELQLNVRVKKEGKKRRSYKRKLTAARASKMEKEKRNPGVYQSTPSPSTITFQFEKVSFDNSSPSSSPPVPTVTASRHQQTPRADLGKQNSEVYQNMTSPSTDNLLGSRHSPYTATYTPELDQYIQSRVSEKYENPEYGGIPTPPTSATGLLSSDKAGYPPDATSHLNNPRDDTASSRLSAWSDTSSLAALVSDAANHVHLDLDDGELADISVAAEQARPGRPKFDVLLADEVQMSRGAIIVGCAYHESLSTFVF